MPMLTPAPTPKSVKPTTTQPLRNGRKHASITNNLKRMITSNSSRYTIRKSPSSICCSNQSAGQLVLVFLLTFQTIHLATLRIKLRLVSSNLLILALVFDLFAFELIANQGASTQTQAASHSGARGRMSNCSPNEPASGSPAERANTRTLFMRCQRSTGAANGSNRDSHDKNGQKKSSHRVGPKHISSFFLRLTKRSFLLRS